MSDPAVTADRQSSGTESTLWDRVSLGIRRRVTSSPWRGRAVAVCLSVTGIAFVVGFLVTVASGGQLALVTKPPALQVVFALPYLVTVLAAGTVVSAISAWRHGYWSLLARVHQTILAVLGVVFVWQLVVLGFVP